MCIARNPYRQADTLLLQVNESPIDAATALQDNIIFTSRSETPLEYEEEYVKAPSSWVNLISRVIVICVIPMIIVTLQRTSRAQDEEMKALQLSMLRMRTLHKRQSRILEDLDIQTQKMDIDFRPL